MAMPNWLLGRHVTAVKVHLQTVNETTGALADASAGTNTLADIVLTTGSLSGGSIAFSQGLLDEIRWMGEADTENISPVNSRVAHHHRTTGGYTIAVTEILRQGSATCLLANLWLNGATAIGRFVFARGGNKWEDYFIMTSYDETLRKGKNVGVMTLASVDNGAAVAYTAADR